MLWLMMWCAACATSPQARAVRAADDGAWEIAAAAYEEAIAESPHDASLWTALGRVRLRMNEPRQARDAFERAGQIGGDSVRLRILIGRTHEIERRYDEALIAYRQATQLEPNSAYAWRFGGARLLRWGDASGAEPWLARAVELEPDHAETWNALAIARVQQGDLPGAETAFHAGLERSPEHRGLYLGLAALLVNASRYPEALAAYDEIVRRWPEFAAAYVGRALVLDTLGRREEAEAAFQSAVSAEPENRGYRRRLNQYRAQNEAVP